MPLAPLSWGSIPLNGPPIQLAICSRRLEPTKLPPGIKYFVWDQIFRGVGEEVAGVLLLNRTWLPLIPCLPLTLTKTKTKTKTKTMTNTEVGEEVGDVAGCGSH